VLLVNKLSLKKQLLKAIALVLFVAPIGLLKRDLTGFRIVAFILVTISILAMFIQTIPALVADALTAPNPNRLINIIIESGTSHRFICNPTIE
jgi:hypothetical protein